MPLPPVDQVLDELDASIRAIYGAEATAYLREHEHRFRHDLELIERIAPGGEILEIGSFPCHATYCFKRRAHAVVGVDLDPSRAAEFIACHGLEVQRCDVEQERLPFAEDRFDMVLCNEVFEHLRINPIFALHEMRRVLKRNGVLVLTTPNLYALRNIASFLRGRGIGTTSPYWAFKQVETTGHMGHVREYSIREIQEFLAHTGFVAEEVQFQSYARSRRGALVDLCYAVVPRWRPYQVVISRKLSTRALPLAEVERRQGDESSPGRATERVDRLEQGRSGAGEAPREDAAPGQ